MIPPVPSTIHDCYYFTNNHEIYEKLKNTTYIRIFVDIPVFDNHILDTQSSKLLRCCPHKFEILSKYEYVCWHDSKLHVYENKVLDAILEMKKHNRLIGLTKHPYSDRFKSIWDEFNLAMEFEKYASQKEQNIKYIQKKIKEGFSEHNDIHYACGFSIRKMCKEVYEYNEYWYSNVLECGIEDQISHQFVRQKYNDIILTLDTNQTWKYCWE